MHPLQKSRAFRHFTKHLFLVGKVYAERNKAKEDIYSHLEKMRKSIIKMKLSYTDIDTLKEKIDNFVNCERKFARYFKPEDNETMQLRKQINLLEQELRKERAEKQMIMSENNEKIKQLTESLGNIKNQMNLLLMEKAKRHHRVKALEHKIRQKVDVHEFYHS